MKARLAKKILKHLTVMHLEPGLLEAQIELTRRARDEADALRRRLASAVREEP
jgi:hypothetical protein